MTDAGLEADADNSEQHDEEEYRFFTTKDNKNDGHLDEIIEEEELRRQRRNATAGRTRTGGGGADLYDDIDDEGEEDDGQGRCLTLRVLQNLPCFKKKSVWEASQGDIKEVHEVEETKYPLLLKILEHRAIDILFVTSCLASIFLFFFSMGFLIHSRTMWGVIHTVNAIYICCLLTQWMQILIKSRYSKTNWRFTKIDIIFTLCCIFPADLIVLAVFTLTDNVKDWDIDSIITICRLGYLLRIFNVLNYFTNWENQLAIGDFVMFVLRIGLYILFFIHVLACVWHRIACKPFELYHFKLRGEEATAELCKPNSWIMILLENQSPLLDHRELNSVLLTHYLVSLYWAVTTAFRLGYGDVKIYLTSEGEVIFTCIAQIAAWILTMATISGTLTSLLIESDTERENFLTRRLRIKYFMEFCSIPKSISEEVKSYYDHLWTRRKGIFHLKLIDKMPKSLKVDVFYDFNKDILQKLPLLDKVEENFIMNLAIYFTHTFYLEGEILFKKNDIGSYVVYIRKGYLEVMSADETQPITNINSGSVLGELYLVQPYPHTATVRCGSDCEIVILTKQKFKEVQSLYPHLEEIFRKRIEARIEDSGIILNLCEKHNEYIQAFNNLHRHNWNSGHKDGAKPNPLILFPSEIEKKEDIQVKTEGEIDELSLQPDALRRYSIALALEREKVKSAEKHQRRSSLEAAAFSALEADVNRAQTLAQDLGIPIPTLIVSAPANKRKERIVVSTGETVISTTNKVINKIRGTQSTLTYFIWKTFITICILTSIWFYLHQLGFGTRETRKWDYIAHCLDVLVAVDFCFDMLEIVIISSHHILHTPCDILSYRVKTFGFYVRLLGFLPLEYPLASVFGIRWGDAEPNHVFYLLKMNRWLELKVVVDYSEQIESWARSQIFIFLIKFCVISLYVIHFFAISYGVILREILKTPLNDYMESLYWATQIITSTGFGDLKYSSDEEVFVLIAGLVTGTVVLQYLSSKISAILANVERKRVAFKQKYFAVQEFMHQRRFPSGLAFRVTKYFQIQWKAHQGVLIPTENSPIFDAPDILKDKVGMASCEEFFEKSPLFRYVPLERCKQFSRTLKQFIVPPDEIVLYPGDKRRELYLIKKGFCQVSSEDGTILGMLSEGNYFGVPGLISGTNREFLIKTATHCHFLCLLFDDFITLAQKSPQLLFEFRVMRGEAKLGQKHSVIGENLKGSSETSNQFYSDSMGNTGTKENTITGLEDDFYSGTHGDTVKKTKLFVQNLKKVELLNNDKLDFILPSKIILPHGAPLSAWVIIRTLSAVLVTAFATAQFCFAFHPLTSFAVFIVFDVIAWIDLYVMFKIAYYRQEHNVLVTKPRSIFLNYLRGSFLIDLLGCLPLEFGVMFTNSWDLFSLSTNDYTYGGNRACYLIAALRLNRIAQGYRLFTVENFLEKGIFKHMSIMTLLEVVPAMFLFIHLMACVAIISVCHWSSGETPLQCEKDSWISRFQVFNPTVNKVLGVDETSWLPKPDYILDPYTMYTIGVYWISQCSVNVGFSDIDIHIKSKSTQLAILAILSGVLASCYVGSKVTAKLVGEDQRRILLRHQMGVIFDFLKQYQVSYALQKRVEQLYFTQWDKTFIGIIPSELFAALHPTLKSDCTKQLYEQKLKKSPLFKNLDDNGLRLLSSRLQETFYREGEYVMRCGDLSEEIFIVSSGLVQALNYLNEKIATLASGSLFGEVSCIFKIERLYSIRALSDTELFVISRENFLDFLTMFPEIKTKLELACLMHLKEALYENRLGESIDVKLPEVVTMEDQKSIARRFSFDQDIEAVRSAIQEKLSIQSIARIFEQEEISVPEQGRSASDRPSNLAESYKVESNNKVGLHELEVGSIVSSTSMDPLRVRIKRPAEQKDRIKSPALSWLNELVTFGSSARHEMKLIHVVQEKSEVKWTNFAIHPSSPICTSSISVCLFLMITCLSCSIVSFELAFTSENEKDKAILILYGVRWTLEVFFIIRLFGNFMLAYYDNNGILVSGFCSIIKYNSFRCWDGLIFDLLTTFPFAEILQVACWVSGCSQVPVLLAHVRSIKLLRVVLFVKYLNAAENDLRMRASNVKIVKISIVFCFIFHFCTCAWYLLACYGSLCVQGSWVDRTAARLQYGQPKLIDSRENITIGMWYFLSLFFVTTTITFTGLDPIEPGTIAELWATIFFIFCTIFIIGYLIGEMTQCLASQISYKIHYQHQVMVLEEHFQNLGLSRSLGQEVHKYYKMFYQKCKGMPYSSLLQGLPYSLRADICFEIFGPNLKSSRLLHKLDERILRQISARIKFDLYLPGSHVVRSGEVCEAMYFIKRGEIVILDQNHNLDLCIEVLYENESFGEIKVLLPKEVFRFSYTARLESEIGILSRQDLDDVLSNYPSFNSDVRSKARRIKIHRMSIQSEGGGSNNYEIESEFIENMDKDQ